MHKFVLEIIYSNYLRNVCPNIHISIFVLKISIVKNVHFEPQLQANSPKPFFVFKVSNRDLVTDDTSAKAF